jgi:hypothetical protein
MRRKVAALGFLFPGAFHWKEPTLGFDYQSEFAPDPYSGHREADEAPRRFFRISNFALSEEGVFALTRRRNLDLMERPR